METVKLFYLEYNFVDMYHRIDFQKIIEYVKNAKHEKTS